MLRPSHLTIRKGFAAHWLGDVQVKIAEHVLTQHKVAIKILNKRKIKQQDMEEKGQHAHHHTRHALLTSSAFTRHECLSLQHMYTHAAHHQQNLRSCAVCSEARDQDPSPFHAPAHHQAV